MRTEYAYTTGDLEAATVTASVSYVYDTGDWKDLLTNYGNQTFDYDEIGNITDDGTWTYDWQYGRQLVRMAQQDDSVTWDFTYNPDGLRLSRSNGTTTYNYVYNGSQLTAMTVGSNTLYFSYDAAGTPMSVKYGNEEYYYTSNIQGDIIGIVDSTGTTVVTYAYDAWGNILSTTDTTTNNLGTLNPLRYRGYTYDQETALYYLQSRYYNPRLGRFINADVFTSTGQGLVGNNMFAYCLNNPIIYVDSAGTIPVCVISKVENTVLSNGNDGTYYATTIHYYWTDTINAYPDPSGVSSVTFYYTVSNSGIISFNNLQSGASLLMVAAIRKTLDSNMMRQTKEKVKGSLKGRTVNGVAFELLAHYTGKIFGKKLGNTKTTEIGASKGKIGYDYNADWYEHPLRNLPTILRALRN